MYYELEAGAVALRMLLAHLMSVAMRNLGAKAVAAILAASAFAQPVLAQRPAGQFPPAQITESPTGDTRRLTVELVLPPGTGEPAGLFAWLRNLSHKQHVSNLVLVLVTAAVTGLAAPRVKAGMDLRYFQKQKKHESDLQRQAKLIEQQITFLIGYIDIVWKFQFSLVKVTYARASGE